MLKQQRVAMVVWSVFLVCALISLLSFLFSTQKDAVVISAVTFAIGAWCAVVPSLWAAVRSQWKMGDELIRNIRSTFLSLQIIDNRLSELARQFDNRCAQQVRLQSTDNAEDELERLSGYIARAKSRFWHAHELAKRLGYNVYDTIGQYLEIKP